MTGIFINYRRDDAPGVAGRLYDHLAKSFSRRDLFVDVDAIKNLGRLMPQAEIRVIPAAGHGWTPALIAAQVEAITAFLQP